MAKTKKEYLADFRKWGLLGGRPRAFKSPREMAEQIASFLEWAADRKIEVATKAGKEKVNKPAPLSEEKFCAFCGISKTTFHDYGEKPEFAPLVEYFKSVAEDYWVDQCAEGQPGNKADFILKNAFGNSWKEKSDVTMNGGLQIVLKKYNWEDDE